MIKNTGDKDSLVPIFKIHFISLKLRYEKDAKLMTSLDNLYNHILSPYNGNNYYTCISRNRKF